MPPPIRKNASAFPESERPTRPRQSPPASAQRTIQLTAAIAALPPDVQQRALELVPELGALLGGVEIEAWQRWCSVVRALGPVLRSKNNSLERRLLELIENFTRLSIDDQEIVGVLALRFSQKRRSSRPPTSK